MIRDAFDVIDIVAGLKCTRPDYLAGVLEGHYNQTFRSYHNFDHISQMTEMIGAMITHKLIVGISAEHQLELQIAALFHDTVYSLRAKSPENEKESADVALVTGLRCFEDNTVDWTLVRRYILATIHDGKLANASLEEKLIADIDLSSLSGSWNEYCDVNKKVVSEYLTMYTEAEVIYGRIQFISGMLARPRIFYLDYFYEDEARENLTKELETLNTGHLLG